MSGFCARCFGGAAAVVALSATAHGAFIDVGNYSLSNHPDGSANPPAYGLRLDELVDVTSGHDIFTFDFDHVLSNMRLRYDGSSIRVWGDAYGGRDTGSGYAADANLGVYSVDFLYTVGVGVEAGDDDLVVIANMQNFGTITTPGGAVIDLMDKTNGDFSFRFGDEDNDAGHRGFAGISGWGWLIHGSGPHVANSDFLFTAELIPSPGAIALLGMGGLVGIRRRR